MSEQSGFVKVRFDFKLDDVTYRRYYMGRKVCSYPEQTMHRATVIASSQEAAEKICKEKYPDWWNNYEVHIGSVRPA